jgi:ribosome-binding protein aMBF1 (putative translation factor)
MNETTVPFESIKEELLQDPEVRAEYEALEPAYQVARLRIARGLTQAELARRVGTKQPSIARLESGRSTPRLPFLKQVAEALDAELVIKLEPK